MLLFSTVLLIFDEILSSSSLILSCFFRSLESTENFVNFLGFGDTNWSERKLSCLNFYFGTFDCGELQCAIAYPVWFIV